VDKYLSLLRKAIQIDWQKVYNYYSRFYSILDLTHTTSIENLKDNSLSLKAIYSFSIPNMHKGKDTVNLTLEGKVRKKEDNIFINYYRSLSRHRQDGYPKVEVEQKFIILPEIYEIYTVISQTIAEKIFTTRSKTVSKRTTRDSFRELEYLIKEYAYYGV